MTSRLAVAGLLACAVGCAPPASGQPRHHAARAPVAAAYVAPRTSFGQPSLEGMWAANFILSMEATPKTPNLSVPETDAKAMAAATASALASFATKALDPEVPSIIGTTDGLPIVRGQRRTRAVVEPADGMLPLTPAGRREAGGPPPQDPFDNPEDRPDTERCLYGITPPPLASLLYLNQLQIIQTRDQILLHTEYGDDLRVIPLAAKHGPKMFYPRFGDSIARWEGDTLVVETIGLPEKGRGRIFPFYTVPGDSTVIERLTRVSKRELLYQFTIVEPKTYAAPWLGEFSWFQTSKPMYEHACHEGNYSLPGILAGARYDEAAAKAVGVAAKR